MIAALTRAERHPVVICDEHQDSSGDQHAIAWRSMDEGARLRVFADPMQKIFQDKSLKASCRVGLGDFEDRRRRRERTRSSASLEAWLSQTRRVDAEGPQTSQGGAESHRPYE